MGILTSTKNKGKNGFGSERVKPSGITVCSIVSINVFLYVSLSLDVQFLCHDGSHGNNAVPWYLFTTLTQGIA